MHISYFDSAFTRDLQKTFQDFSMEALMNGAFSKFCDVRDTNEFTTNVATTEGSNNPSWVPESGEFPVRELNKGYRGSFVAQHYAQKLIVSKDTRVKSNDSMEKISTFLQDERDAAINNMYDFMEKQVHLLLNTATTTTNFVALDGQPIISASHVWQTGGTFSNLMSSAPLSIATVNAAAAYGGSFTAPLGQEMPLNFDTIIVKKGGAASRAARQLFGIKDSGQYKPTTIGGINIYFGEYTIIETPWMTNGNAYFFMNLQGRYKSPFLFDIVQSPTMADLKEETNLDWVYPYDAYVKIGVQDMPFNVLYNA